MRQKSGPRGTSSEKLVKDIRRATRKRYSAEEKIRIVLDGLSGEETIAELCRREGSAQGLNYSWSKEFLDAGKKQLAGDTARAAIGTGEAFERGRDFGAWLGLVPKQYSTGGRSILGRITKRGNRSLRTLFVQAAHVILMRPNNWEKFSSGPWLKETSMRMHKNKLAAALANKLARIAWSVLRHGNRFDHHRVELEAI